MAKEKNPNLEKKTLNLIKGDCEIIGDFFPSAGYSLVIREVVHKFARRLQERENLQKDPTDERITFDPSEPD